MSTEAPAIVDSLPKAPLPLSFLVTLEESDSIDSAAALIVGGNEGGEDYMLQFILRTDTRTHVLTLPADEDDPDRWHVLCSVNGADEQAWNEAILESKVWRDERGLPADAEVSPDD